MSARGPYAKGVAKRAEILEVALEIIARNGYSGATVKELADAVGLSQNGLLHYFGSKDALFTEILRRRDEVDSASFPETIGEPDIATGVTTLVAHNAAVPGFVQLYARLSNEAAEPDHPSHEYFQERYRIIRENGVQIFTDLQRKGEVRADLDPTSLGIQLFALIDGLQTQWMYAPDAVDMPGEIARFFELLKP